MDEGRLHALLPGERVLWEGRPVFRRPRSGTAVGWILVALGLFSAAGAVLLLVQSSQFAAGRVGNFTLGLAVSAQCWALALDVLVYRQILTAATVYTVTDWRLLCTTGSRRRVTASAELRDLGRARVEGFGDGTAVVRFEHEPAEHEPAEPGRGASLATRQTVAELRRRAASFVFTEQDAMRLADAVNRFGDPGLAAARMKRESGLGRVPDAAPEPEPEPAPAHVAPSWAVAASLTASGRQLEDGEYVCWIGRSARPRWWYSPGEALVSVLVAVFLGGFAAAELLFAREPHSGFGDVMAVPTIIAVLYFGVGRMVLRRMRTKHSTYLLTSRRLVKIREFGRWRRVQDVPLASLAMPYLYDDGTIEFPRRSLAKHVAPGPQRNVIATTYLAASAFSASRTFIGLDDADAKTVYEHVDMLLPIAAAAGRPSAGRPSAGRSSAGRPSAAQESVRQ